MEWISSYRTWIIAAITGLVIVLLFLDPLRNPANNWRLLADQLGSQMQAAVAVDQQLSMKLPYRLFVPPAISEGKSYPLILTLHGAGGRGSDNLKHLDESVKLLISSLVQGIEPVFVLAPQCPESVEWLDVDQSAPYLNYDMSVTPESERTKLILIAVENVIKKNPIDESRIYITGFSMGGAGTWDLISRYPNKFVAAIPINGINDPDQASKLVHLPIRAFHGIQDKISPVENSRKMLSALRRESEKAGIELKASLTEFNSGHSIINESYSQSGLFKWLTQQRRP